MNIALGICTYRRPQTLRKLLDALCLLDGDYTLNIVVADNDAGLEGIATCENLPAGYPHKVHAMSVTSSGISAVRNAVATKALSFAPEFIAFLDDDEWPEAQWLSELLRIQSLHDADVVGGPTRPVFPDNTDKALLDNPYYGADLSLADGTRCQLQAGGNFLIKAAVMKRYAPQFFHEAFAHSGSEDLAFFSQLGNDGYHMRWAAHAIVHEPVPESRLAPDWLRQRIINIHNSRVRVMQLQQPGVAATTTRLLKTAALAAVTCLLTLAGMLIPRYRQPAQLLRWKLKGKLTAHFGEQTRRGETY